MAIGTWKRGKRAGRTKYALAVEGSSRELDVASARCKAIRSDMTLKTDDADAEVFDLEDPAQPPAVEIFGPCKKTTPQATSTGAEPTKHAPIRGEQLETAKS